MRPSHAQRARGDRSWPTDALRLSRVGSPLLLLSLLSVLSSVMACAMFGPRAGSDGRFHHSDPDYSVATPDFAAATPWKQISLDDTDLAWRTSDGRSMSLSSSCKRTRAEPALLARRLLIGIPKDDVISAHPVALRGAPGWAQIISTGGDAHPIWIKTVTVVSAGCVFDWVLVAAAGDRFDESVSTFDAWWTSFERGRVDDDPEPEEPVSPDPEEAGP